MARLSQLGVESRTGLMRVLLGRDTILFEEIRAVRVDGGAIHVELIDGSRRRLRLGAQATAVGRQLDRLLHPARELLGGINAVQDLQAALASLEPVLPSALLELLLLGSARLGATDIHLEQDRGLRLRVRVDGLIHDLGRLESPLSRRVLGRLKVMARLISYRDDVTQEGRALAQLDGASVSARVTTSAGFAGEQATIRLHDEKKATLELEQLGFDDAVVNCLRAAARLRRGLVLVAGPPSSGKSTTLFALLRRLQQIHGGSRRMISIEDPVEVELPGVAQSQVDALRGNSHARLLATALRQDADVILVGEMRDSETAHLALQAALCGHLVLTSVHAGGVGEAMVRLRDLGLEQAALASTLRVVVAQRLMRCRCTACTGYGCSVCHQTGFLGRIAVGEGVTVNASCLLPLTSGCEASQIESTCVEDADMIPLLRAAQARIAQGVTTPEEVERVLG